MLVSDEELVIALLVHQAAQTPTTSFNAQKSPVNFLLSGFSKALFRVTEGKKWRRWDFFLLR